jgi:hypothetical protein
MIWDWRDKQAKEDIKNYIINNFSQINVTAGKCRYNYKCHMNSVHDAIENEDEYIAMCVYFDDSPIIHFLNIVDGKYIDNTLGHWCSLHKYYLIKKIPKSDFFNIDNIFSNFRKELGYKISKVNRIFSQYRG